MWKQEEGKPLFSAIGFFLHAYVCTYPSSNVVHYYSILCVSFHHFMSYQNESLILESICHLFVYRVPVGIVYG